MHCEREHRQAACLPIRPLTLRFSNAVARELARQAVLIGPDAQHWRPEIDRDDGTTQYVTSISFKGAFPESVALRLELPEGLTDDAGRSPANVANFPLQVETAEFPPLAKFAARFGIIGWKARPVLPVTLRNLEPEVKGKGLQLDAEGATPERAAAPDGGVVVKHWRVSPEHVTKVLRWLRRVAVAKRGVSVFDNSSSEATPKAFQLPKPHGAHPLEVIGIPLDGPGLYIVELASPRLGLSLLEKSQPMYVPTVALVTNLAVHFKWGREGSLIWVTTLDDGRPMPAAQVAVYDCRGTALWSGITDEQGLARPERLPNEEVLPSCPYDGNLYHYDYRQTTAINRLDGGLFVAAQVQDDFSFVDTSSDLGIEPWRFQLPMAGEQNAIVARTVLDRSLFRAGDTVHMKHILRVQDLRGFSRAPADQSPNLLSIRHLGSEERYEFLVQWDVIGVAENTWTIPKGAKLGHYQIVLVRKSNPQGRNGGVEPEWISGEFRVEEFRVPVMRGIIQASTALQIGVTELPVDLAVQYLAGGGAGHLPVVLRAQLRPKSVVFPTDFEGFVFANGQVKEAIVRSGSRVAADDEASRLTAEKGAVHQRLELRLDAAGTGRATITELPQAAVPLDLLLELEYSDPNGEVQTVATTVALWPTPQLVGLKLGAWMASTERLTVQAATVDVAGPSMAGIPVRLDVLERKFYSYRKRLIGGFYAYEHVEETRSVGELCRGNTDAHGVLVCEGKPPVGGNLIIQASLAQEDGRVSSAHQSMWVPGAPHWFDVEDSDRIDVRPEKRRYEPGDTARFQVRMPFRQATALVTVEREGVREAYVVPLSGQDPVVEVPVQADYAPNMFVSVLAVRGRVTGVPPTAMIDLGKPSFKLGMAEVRVDWRRYELKVNVTADRSVYRVRDKALVHIVVRTSDGQLPPPAAEVAVAAVDEGLLELLPNTSWNLLDAMMGRRGYSVQTATAQLEVVGKRHYGLKALPQGGGGGKQLTRELFDTLLLWNGHVPLDANGEAPVEVPLNDSPTSFRIAVVATSGLQLFGTGATTIRTSQDLMILSGIAPLVREGDQIWSEFTLRNTTDRSMDITVTARVEGLATPLVPQTVRLASGEAKAVGWDVVVPPGVPHLRYEVEATERGRAVDRLRVPQQVVPAVPVRTFQATLSQWQQGMAQAVARPADALPGQDGVAVLIRSSIADGLDSMRQWMGRYPYTCLEQQVSRAVALRDEDLWRDLVGALPAHLDVPARFRCKWLPCCGRSSVPAACRVR